MAGMKLPQTAEEMQAIIFSVITQRAYQAITAAARRGRLTEHEIAVIERNIIDEVRGESDFAHEFPTFEAEPAVAKGRAEAKAYFAAVKTARQRDVGG